jgi:putative transposase
MGRYQKKLRYFTINWFRGNTKKIGVSMNRVYGISGVSKQAVHQYNKDQADWAHRVFELQILIDEVRAIHPGCGLEKLYDTLKPSWLGRDKFIAVFMGLGYRVKKERSFIRTTIPAVLRYPSLIEGLLVWDKLQDNLKSKY